MEVDEEGPKKDSLDLFLSSPALSGRALDTTSAPEPTLAKEPEEKALTSTCYVEIPKLGDEELAKYTPVEQWEDLDKVGETQLVEIVSEYTHLGTRYLYGLYEDGILRKKEDDVFRTCFPEHYEDYEKRLEDKQVTMIHPSHKQISAPQRLNPVTVPRSSSRRLKRSRSSRSASIANVDSSDDGSIHKKRILRPRRIQYSTRAKIRGRTSVEVESEDEDEYNEESDSDEGLRRSGRNVSRKDYRMDVDFEVNDESDDDDEILELESGSDESQARGSKARPKARHRRAPKPAYGRIRSMEDLEDSDSETEPLKRHRNECEKCHRAASLVLVKKLKSRRKKKKTDGDFSENDEEFYNNLGGWVRCLKCCVTSHWRCLTKQQRDDIVRAVRSPVNNAACDPSFRDLDMSDTTEFICGMCSKRSTCMGCEQVTTEEMIAEAEGEESAVDKTTETPDELLFRCISCKRVAHYAHLFINTDDAEDEDITPEEKARFFQEENSWQCSDCASYRYPLDKVLAWRHTPPNAVDKYTNAVEKFNYKENLPREYLVKWGTRSYRRLQWVPHMWMVSTQYAKLKNFYEQGPKVQLLSDDISSYKTTSKPKGTLFATGEESSRAVSVDAEAEDEIPRMGAFPTAKPDAESRIPTLWTTIERVLDVKLRFLPDFVRPRKGKQRVVEDEDMDVDSIEPPQETPEIRQIFDEGQEPAEEMTEAVEEFEDRMRRGLQESDIDRVLWAFIKWDDLPYEEATWDAPPRKGEPGYDDFHIAFKRYLVARTVVVRKKKPDEADSIESRDKQGNWSAKSVGIVSPDSHDIGQDKSLSLMPFQVDGINWLCKNWFYHQTCILADEMGLGKTVQIINFIGLLKTKLDIFPSLVVVPNSTITNWVREFTKWAPDLRVVPFYGDQASREIIKQYELQHSTVAPNTTGAKYHVLIATYESVTSPKDFNFVFKKNPRWEVLVVDEGQRLKNDSSLIFKRLNELRTCHRVIMTGTPLNNNIRELLNLMNFLDPDKWADLEGLEKEFEELDEERVKEMHERLRPYFLRRVKADVLDLPPKNEIIVPLSMAPLQKEIYKSLLSNNFSLLKNLHLGPNARVNKSNASRSNLRNLLMQLRKCLQHPYLVADDIEDKALSRNDAHIKLIDACGKLRFLKMLLPKLKERGHRVLLFSQFVIGLNIIEDFLEGEGYKYLRLDGNKKQSQRQKEMDLFNAEGSDVFIYILSTRAGGVGINLWSADTVIIFDPDFNPHQDLQAIARAHRYGQKKTVLVFKFMTKNSVEEKIVQVGKKKLVLDHLIVQKMDDDEDSTEVQSMLTFGAAALFEEEENRDIKYSEQDVQSLIEKIEKEGDQDATAHANNALSFAKVWSAQKGELDEIPENADEQVEGDSWAQTLQKIAKEQSRVQAEEKSGRGVKRRAAQAKVNYVFESPTKEGVKKKGRGSQFGKSDVSDGEYDLPNMTSDSASSAADPTEMQKQDDLIPSLEDPVSVSHVGPYTAPEPGNSNKASDADRIRTSGQKYCGLCATYHGPLACPMTMDTISLAEFRKLIIYKSKEPYETRLDAVASIDQELEKRGALRMVEKQPHFPVQHLTGNASTSIPAIPNVLRRQPPVQSSSSNAINSLPPAQISSDPKNSTSHRREPQVVAIPVNPASARTSAPTTSSTVQPQYANATGNYKGPSVSGGWNSLRVNPVVPAKRPATNGHRGPNKSEAPSVRTVS